MTQRHTNHFVIRNDLAGPLTLNIEPEGALFPLAQGEEGAVTDVFHSAPVTVVLTQLEQGGPIVSIWPGDGEVKVRKGGVDVLDLVQGAPRVAEEAGATVSPLIPTT